MRVHKGENEYKWSLCNKRFTTFGNLERHNRCVHINITDELKQDENVLYVTIHNIESSCVQLNLQCREILHLIFMILALYKFVRIYICSCSLTLCT